jgi:hypothetical protein
MAVRAKAQASFDEQILEDADLEARLERRETAKRQRGAVSQTFRELDEQVKGDILKMGTTGVLRCGRFRIDVKPRASHSVSFETKPGTSVRITAPEAD